MKGAITSVVDFPGDVAIRKASARGGYNRGESLVPTTSPLHGVFKIPVSYNTDTLNNYEIGWKTTLFDRRLQFDGAAYMEKWSNVQLSVFDTAIYVDLTFTANGPDYQVKGLETSVSFRATEGLTLMGSSAWNHSEQMTAPQLQGTTGQTYALFATAGAGSPLAQAPPLQFNLRARYEWSFGDYRAWPQGAGAAHGALVRIGRDSNQLRAIALHDLRWLAWRWQRQVDGRIIRAEPDRHRGAAV